MSDAPVEVSFKELKKGKRLLLSQNLQTAYNEGLRKMHRKPKRNDPRFDPNIYGVCELKEWKFLDEDRDKTINKLQKELKNQSLSEEQVTKTKAALRLLKQRTATVKDGDFRRQTMQSLQNDQVEALKSGRRVKFLRRAELRQMMQQKRMQGMSKKKKERYAEKKRIDSSSKLTTNQS